MEIIWWRIAIYINFSLFVSGPLTPDLPKWCRNLRLSHHIVWCVRLLGVIWRPVDWTAVAVQSAIRNWVLGSSYAMIIHAKRALFVYPTGGQSRRARTSVLRVSLAPGASVVPGPICARRLQVVYEPYLWAHFHCTNRGEEPRRRATAESIIWNW